MINSHNKPIIEETPYDISESLPHFNKQDFDEAVFEHGYSVTLERALRCPCAVEANNGALSNCTNCGGGGWVFINKRSTVIVTQSMNRNTKF